MWIYAAYVVSTLVILALLFHDKGWYRQQSGVTTLVYVIVAFIPFVNTVVAILVIALSLAGLFMSKATRSVTGDPEDTSQ